MVAQALADEGQGVYDGCLKVQDGLHNCIDRQEARIAELEAERKRYKAEALASYPAETEVSGPYHGMMPGDGEGSS